MITVRLPETVQKELENLAKSEKSTKSEIVREAVSRYIALKKFRRLRGRVMPFAEAQGLLTDEDIFKIIS